MLTRSRNYSCAVRNFANLPLYALIYYIATPSEFVTKEIDYFLDRPAELLVSVIRYVHFYSDARPSLRYFCIHPNQVRRISLPPRG